MLSTRKSLAQIKGTPNIETLTVRTLEYDAQIVAACHGLSNAHLLGRPLGIGPTESKFYPAQRISCLVGATRFSVLFHNRHSAEGSQNNWKGWRSPAPLEFLQQNELPFIGWASAGSRRKDWQSRVSEPSLKNTSRNSIIRAEQAEKPTVWTPPFFLLAEQLRGEPKWAENRYIFMFRHTPEKIA